MHTRTNFHAFCSLFICFWVFLLFSLTAKAQVCNGSFGDPAVNLTFGKGSSGPSAYVPSSGYTYTSSCPDDGYYTITDHIANCFGGTWHVTNDHTGGGNFLLVNASYKAGDFFLTSVTSLCPNTTYEFSAWIMNVMKPLVSIRPNVTFSIEKPDGTILASVASGDIPVTVSPEWNNYGILFTTPSNNATIVLRLTNNAPGGYGNDVGLDDITFRPCGAKIGASIQGQANTIDVCEGNNSVFNFLGDASSLYNSPVYRWQQRIDTATVWSDINGGNSLNFTRNPTPVGNYSYRFTVSDASVANIPSCRITSPPFFVNVHPTPIVNAGPTLIYIKDYPVTISAVATGENISFNWVPALYMNDTSILNPIVTPPVDTKYSLFVKSAYGCTNSQSTEVKVVGGLFVPNAFTPNNDRKNDCWRIPYLELLAEAEVSVFNRWGTLLYHVSNAPVSWDGTFNNVPQPIGQYIYIIKFKHNKFPDITGSFTLIR